MRTTPSLRLYFLLILALALGLQDLGYAGQPPLALVYRGKGSCSDGCSEAAAKMAREAGYEPRYISPDDDHPELFDLARVWIQPGGKSSEVAQTMVPALKRRIRHFVARGNGYVGFCAGGFFATRQIDGGKTRGLGILPGSNGLFMDKDGGFILPLSWEGTERYVYYEGGPFFIAPAPGAPEPSQMDSESYEVIATYADGKPAAVRARYGQGRVIVSGVHPEAPLDWKTSQSLMDPDGDDDDLAVQMIQWATGVR